MPTPSKTDYRSLYDKDFIGAWDLQDGDKVIKIKKVIGGSLTSPGGRKTKKPVIYFHGSEKGFALNATNGKTIAALYGNFTEAWVGKSLTLYKSMTRNPDGGGDVECIRVRPEAPRSFNDGEPVISAEQYNELVTALKAKGISESAFCAAGEVDTAAELYAANFAKAMKWIAGQPATPAPTE